MRRMRAEIRGMAALRPCKWKRAKLYRKFQREYRHCPASPDFGPTSKRRGAVARFLDRTARKKDRARDRIRWYCSSTYLPFLARIWRLVIEISKPPHNAPCGSSAFHYPDGRRSSHGTAHSGPQEL